MCLGADQVQVGLAAEAEQVWMVVGSREQQQETGRKNRERQQVEI